MPINDNNNNNNNNEEHKFNLVVIYLCAKLTAQGKRNEIQKQNLKETQII
jgi:hypothetical protein